MRHEIVFDDLFDFLPLIGRKRLRRSDCRRAYEEGRSIRIAVREVDVIAQSFA